MKIVSGVKIKISEIAKTLINKYKEMINQTDLKKSVSSPTPEYDHYLTEQIRRTIVKNSNSLLPRTEILINLIFEKGKPATNSRVLCAGCRNTEELDYFQAKGLRDVTGIDLFSENPRIQVMDMHKLKFTDNSFDIVYSSHSLEHSYDINQVVGEFVRVSRNQTIIALEVPVRYQITEADRHDLKNVDGVMALFSNYKTIILWSDDLETRVAGNNEGTPIVRVIFRLEK